MTLHTIEQSHGKPRLTGPRLTALGTVPTAGERSLNHTARGTFASGNDAARERASKAALRRPYREARKRVREALAAGAEPEVADLLLTDALSVYLAAHRELGGGRVLTEGGVIAYATGATLAGYYTAEAVKAGLLTEQGMLLHDRALACEAASSRGLTAALAATKALGRRRPGKTRAPSYFEAEGEAAE